MAQLPLEGAALQKSANSMNIAPDISGTEKGRAGPHIQASLRRRLSRTHAVEWPAQWRSPHALPHVAPCVLSALGRSQGQTRCSVVFWVSLFGFFFGQRLLGSSSPDQRLNLGRGWDIPSPDRWTARGLPVPSAAVPSQALDPRTPSAWSGGLDLPTSISPSAPPHPESPALPSPLPAAVSLVILESVSPCDHTGMAFRSGLSRLAPRPPGSPLCGVTTGSL